MIFDNHHSCLIYLYLISVLVKPKRKERIVLSCRPHTEINKSSKTRFHTLLRETIFIFPILMGICDSCRLLFFINNHHPSRLKITFLASNPHKLGLISLICQLFIVSTTFRSWLAKPRSTWSLNVSLEETYLTEL